ncbi:hypothetical protein BJV74DRAFT_989952 [Russula compacta]|nr:hypothetical protein BJV74DRAFT_989952 [Russula compacta]
MNHATSDGYTRMDDVMIRVDLASDQSSGTGLPVGLNIYCMLDQCARTRPHQPQRFLRHGLALRSSWVIPARSYLPSGSVYFGRSPLHERFSPDPFAPWVLCPKATPPPQNSLSLLAFAWSTEAYNSHCTASSRRTSKCPGLPCCVGNNTTKKGGIFVVIMELMANSTIPELQCCAIHKMGAPPSCFLAPHLLVGLCVGRGQRIIAVVSSLVHTPPLPSMVQPRLPLTPSANLHFITCIVFSFLR